MIGTIQKAIGLMMTEYDKEFGEGTQIEEGEEIVAVFNDGVVIISVENGQLSIKISEGEPYRIDYNLNLFE